MLEVLISTVPFLKKKTDSKEKKNLTLFTHGAVFYVGNPKEPEIVRLIR